METSKLRKFAQFARRSLIEQVSAKLKVVLAESSEARRENAEAVKKLEAQIKHHGEEQVVEKVAYIWFNRFCAMRFMDMNRYTRIGVVSPDEGQFQPEILAEAKMGHIDEDLVSEKIRKQIFALLDGKAPSRDPQGEAYRLLVVGACNHWHRAMPFLFERIDDYTELLMPDDLLSGNSILAYTREAMTPDACKDVEVVGWLYQFYISEKKDEVFASLKKGKKIIPENIPAATQLFTPHWIVRYLVENSLGRLWMLNRPASRLIEKMDYYIPPEKGEPRIDTNEHEKEIGVDSCLLVVQSPEEIKICDPACGSGHMLVYAFDLLFAIYEEEGYDLPDISHLILEKNLYGVEIDERAGALSAFALAMKARGKYSRFFAKPVQPQICVLENIAFEEKELKPYMDQIGRDLFTINLQETLHQFRETNNFGSLIRPALSDVEHIRCVLSEKNVGQNIFLYKTHEKVLKALKQADFLSPKYHVVVANPPYMGGKGMNGRLLAWLKDNYPDSYSDLLTCFMERARELTRQNSFWGMINLPSWMFLGSFENVRKKFISESTILSLLHLGRGIFGADFGTVAFVVQNTNPDDFAFGVYRRLFEEHVQVRNPEKIRQLFFNKSKGYFIFKQKNLNYLPGTPIAYWVGKKVIDAFSNLEKVRSLESFKRGIATGDNGKFLRYWHEVSVKSTSFFDTISNKKWFKYNKGGEFRKWYGNLEYVVNWENDGFEILNFKDVNGKLRSRPQNVVYNFYPVLTYSSVTSGKLSLRIFDEGLINDQAGNFLPMRDFHILRFLGGFMNSKPASSFLNILNPTLNILVENLNNLPIANLNSEKCEKIVQALCEVAKLDWNSYEIAWGFTSFQLLNSEYRQPTLKVTYNQLREHWQEITLDMQRFEEENNRIFIDAYGLQDELTPEVPLKEITLTCNPHYRYNSNKSEEELESLLLADTMKEFISYAVGCMFGRYALDKPGLILANQGETIEDYFKQIPDPTFPADDDNVIPILDGDWFIDDITERFRAFLRVTFGEERYEENLAFIENAIGKEIRKFFLKDFYTDHVKRYKKRPIYWMFSSPRGSFNALIYMHRYGPDTVSIILNDYLRDFKSKLSARKDHLEQISISASAGQGEKTKAIKKIEKLKKMIDEIEDWERDVLYPLASRRIEIDLDDGVKVDYNKFGKALKKVPGLSAN